MNETLFNRRPNLTNKIETILLSCGRERVSHNDGDTPMIMINVNNLISQKSFVIGKGCDYNDAAREAAKSFVRELEAHVKVLKEWADNIKRAMKEEQQNGAK